MGFLDAAVQENVMAGNVMLSVPILALFALAQRRILRAVTARALG